VAEGSTPICASIAIAVTLATYAMSFGSAKAGDDGDCCSSLEDRIAKLESEADKGNTKVSVTVSGWLEKSATQWSDGGGQGTKPSLAKDR
jgi:hypothetical protein